jgi:hypothetical protein
MPASERRTTLFVPHTTAIAGWLDVRARLQECIGVFLNFAFARAWRYNSTGGVPYEAGYL